MVLPVYTMLHTFSALLKPHCVLLRLANHLFTRITDNRSTAFLSHAQCCLWHSILMSNIQQ
jgi:hypothetical protein